MCCVLIISVGVTSVRVADRLNNYISVSIGAFTYKPVHGLIHIRTHGFITILLSATGPNLKIVIPYFH